MLTASAAVNPPRWATDKHRWKDSETSGDDDGDVVAFRPRRNVTVIYAFSLTLVQSAMVRSSINLNKRQIPLYGLPQNFTSVQLQGFPCDVEMFDKLHTSTTHGLRHGTQFGVPMRVELVTVH